MAQPAPPAPATVWTIGHSTLPIEAFLRLLFGHRSLDQLFDAWPDTIVKPSTRPLIHALFPRLESFLYLPYEVLSPPE